MRSPHIDLDGSPSELRFARGVMCGDNVVVDGSGQLVVAQHTQDKL